MGIKSVVNADRLYWLGRYSERVYTTLKLFARSFDQLIEQVGATMPPSVPRWTSPTFIRTGMISSPNTPLARRIPTPSSAT